VQLRAIANRFISSRRGSIAAEFALLAPLIVTLLICTINYGAAMMARTELFNAVRAGLQYGLIYPTNLTGMQTAVQNASSLETGAGTINVTATNSCYCKDGTVIASNCTSASCGGGDDYQVATISATQTYSYLLQFPGFTTPITFSETASIRNSNN